MKATAKIKVLFVHTAPHNRLSSFVQQDLDCLRQMYEVDAIGSPSIVSRPFGSPAFWRIVRRYDVVFGWFGTAAPAIIAARLMGKPGILVAGGFDVVDMPEIGYGLSTPQLKRQRFWIRLGFDWARRVLLFSEASRQSLLAMRGIRPDNLQTLHLGIDADRFRPQGDKLAHALTVGVVNTSNLRRKGLQTFVAAANTTPEIPYRLGGQPLQADAVAQLQTAAPVNFTYLGHLSEGQLLAEYQQAKVYAQLSMHEGFGMALAEAMACACVPVVTAAGSLPEVVGDTGFYVPVEDPEAAGRAIRQACSSDRSAGQRARQRIADLFPPSKRREGLRQAIEAAVAR
jgi:glycosyltransferase involved in cell wall biosynthesis